MVQVHFLLLPTRQLSEHSVHRPGPQRGGSRQVVEEGRGRGTGRWQRRANKVGLGTSRLYPDEGGGVRVPAQQGIPGQGHYGIRDQWQKRSVVLGAASCSLGLRNLEGQVKARPQKAG